MKFVLVNCRTPVVPSKCAACRRPVEKGYMRDLSTLRRYCGAECYPGWNGNVPPLRPCAEINPFELILNGESTSDIVSALFGLGEHQHAASLQDHSERCGWHVPQKS